MDATTTARRVCEWSAVPTSPPPVGPLTKAAGLAHPDDELRELVGDFTRWTAARLGAGDPPLGDRSPVGLGVLLLAAAIGGRFDAERATTVISAVPPSTGWSDALARHGIVGLALRAESPDAEDPATEPPTSGAPGAGGVPAGGRTGPAGIEAPVRRELSWPSARLADALIEASPLSTVLHRPTLRRLEEQVTTAEVQRALDLLDRPRGRRLLCRLLAIPSRQTAVLRWRRELLERLRAEHVDAVLDVYVAARLRHGDEWAERLRQAGRVLRRTDTRGDRLAIATAGYWVPLEAISRSDAPLIRERPYLVDRVLGDDDLPGRRLLSTAFSLVRRHRLELGGGP